MTMIERVTRAIADDWNAGREPWMSKLEAESLARAAIEAMREPTAEMIRAGEPVVYDCYSLEPGEGLDENPAVPTWQAMIDAALADNVRS